MLVNPLDDKAVRKKVEEIQDKLKKIQDEVRSVAERKKRPRPGEQEVDFGVGDYVLTSTESPMKLHPRWEGPAQVTAMINPRRFVVKNLVTGNESEWHAENLKRYADKDLVVTDQLVEFAAQGGRGYVVEAILNHRWNPDLRQWELEILWEGYPRDEATWEPFVNVNEDVPVRVRAYVNAMDDEDDKEQLLVLLTGRRAPRKKARGRNR